MLTRIDRWRLGLPVVLVRGDSPEAGRRGRNQDRGAEVDRLDRRVEILLRTDGIKKVRVRVV